jgi:hypothetical protein
LKIHMRSVHGIDQWTLLATLPNLCTIKLETHTLSNNCFVLNFV